MDANYLAQYDELQLHSERSVSEDSAWATLAFLKFFSSTNESEPFGKKEELWVPLDKYASTTSFDPAAYEQVKQRSLSEWKDRVSKMRDRTRTEMSAHLVRLRNLFVSVLEDSSHLGCSEHEISDELAVMLQEKWIFANLPGTEPSAWPLSLPTFLQSLKELVPFRLWLEPVDEDFSFFKKIEEFIQQHQDDLALVNQALQAMLLLGFLTGNGTRLTYALLKVWKFTKTHRVSDDFIEALNEACEPHVKGYQQLLQLEQATLYPQYGSCLGSFSIAHHEALSKFQNLGNSSLTTDGEFLYLYSGIPNGGMFKIGTGLKNSLPGKVYLFTALDRVEEASWVYCKGKLYLRSQNAEAGVVSVICPNTLKSDGLLQLYCPEIFGTPLTQALNKHYPILTDGTHLCVVGIKVNEEEKQGETATRTCDFSLYKFDVVQLKNSSKYAEAEPDELAKEIYEGFSGYFTVHECQRAMKVSKDDIQAAVQWLVEYGENERGKKFAAVVSSTLLSQSYVATFNASRPSKPELTFKGDTLLSPDMMTQCNWTLDETQLTLFLPTQGDQTAAARVFSTSPDDVRPLSISKIEFGQGFSAQVLNSKTFQDRLKEQSEPSALLGTFLCHKECDRPLRGDVSLTTYDLTSKRFYSFMLNWSFMSVQVYSNVNAFAKATTLKAASGADSAEQFVLEGLKLVQESEMMRHRLPWKWSSLSEMYAAAYVKFQTIKNNGVPAEFQDRFEKTLKRLASRIYKTVNKEHKALLSEHASAPLTALRRKKDLDSFKSNPVNLMKYSSLFQVKGKTTKTEEMVPAAEVPHILTEAGKVSLLCLNRSSSTLAFLAQEIEQFKREPALLGQLMQLLFYWTVNGDHSTRDKEAVRRVREVLWTLTHSDTEITPIAWKILVIGWEIWCPKPNQQFRWLSFILETSQFAKVESSLRRRDSFIYSITVRSAHFTHSDLYGDCNDPLLLWCLKHVKDQPGVHNEGAFSKRVVRAFEVLVDQRDTKQSVQSASLLQLKRVDNRKKTYINDQLLTSAKHPAKVELLWQLIESGLIQGLREPSSQETSAVFDILYYLVKQASKPKELKSSKLCGRLARCLASVLDNFTSNSADWASTMYTKWLSQLKVLVNYCVNLLSEEDASEADITDLLRASLKLFQAGEVNLLHDLLFTCFTGSDIGTERIFETNHPYQRGKQQINENIYFPGAVAITIDIDPRSQSDGPYDCLFVSSVDSTPSFTNYNGEIFAPHFKLSGRSPATHQLFLQGDSVHIEFNASSQAREEGLSNRWGFRARVRPFYADSKLYLKAPSKQSLMSRMILKFGSDVQLLQWASVIHVMAFNLGQISKHLLVTKAGGQSNDLLKWNLFRSGLVHNHVEDRLLQENGTLVLVDPVEPEAQDNPELALLHQAQLAQIEDGSSPLYIVLEALRKLKPGPLTYRAERSRQKFTKELQGQWTQCEVLILYTQLYHTQQLSPIINWVLDPSTAESGLVHEQLLACGSKINDVLTWMLLRLQSEREKMQAVQDIFEQKHKRLALKEPVEETKQPPPPPDKMAVIKSKSKKAVRRMYIKPVPKKKTEEAKPLKAEVTLSPEDKTDIFKEFAQHILGNDTAHRDLCVRFDVGFSEGPESLRQVFDQCWELDPAALLSPYKTVADHVVSRLTLLLKFKPHFQHLTEKEIESEEEPVKLKRAVTSYEEGEDLEEKRKWLDSYKRWKQWQKPSLQQEDMTSTGASPLKAIAKFVTLESFPDQLISNSQAQALRAAKRAIGLQKLANLDAFVVDTPFLRASVGLLSFQSCFEDIESCGTKLSTVINEQAGSVYRLLMQDFKSKMKFLKTVKLDRQKLPGRTEVRAVTSQVSELLLSHQLRETLLQLLDLFTLLNHSQTKEFLLRTQEELEIGELVDAMLVGCELGKQSVHLALVSTVKLILFSLIQSLNECEDIGLKLSLQDSLLKAVLEPLAAEANCEEPPTHERCYKIENLLTIAYEVLTKFTLKTTDLVVRLSITLQQLLRLHSSPAIVRLVIRIAKSVWKTINPELMSADIVDKLLARIGATVRQVDNPPVEDESTVTVMLHSVSSEEEVLFLFPALLEWQSRYPESLAFTEVKKDDEVTVAPDVEAQMLEELYGDSPFEVDQSSERFRFFGMYGSVAEAEGRGRRGGRRSIRRQNSKRPAPVKRSLPVSVGLAKLEKCFDEAANASKDPAEDAEEAEKMRRQSEKEFNKQIKRVFRGCQTIVANLMQKGVAHVLEPMSVAQAKELVQLLYSTQNQYVVDTKNKLPVIPLNPYLAAPPAETASEVTQNKRIIQSSLWQTSLGKKLEFTMESGASLPASKNPDRLSSILAGSYVHPLQIYHVQTGAAASFLVKQLSELLLVLIEEEQWQVLVTKQVHEALPSITQWSTLAPVDQQVALGALVFAGGWPDFLRPGVEAAAYKDAVEEHGVVIQGGPASGLKDVALLHPGDASCTITMTHLSQVKPKKVQGIDKIAVSKEDLSKAIVSGEGDQHIKRALLKLASDTDWSEWLQDQDHSKTSEFVKALLRLSESCPNSKKGRDFEELFAQVWTELITWQDPSSRLVAVPEKSTEQLDVSAFITSDESSADSLTEYTLPASSFLSALPESNPSKSNDSALKMLKHWEKYIIPRIQEFVKTSFKKYEMEEFFEQLRFPLRLGNQQRAAEIALVLCDQRLPAGVVLPDANHDWSAMTLDECMIGNRALVKLKSKHMTQADIPTLKKLDAQGVDSISVVLRAVDLRASLVLAEFIDEEHQELMYLWVPASAISNPETSLRMPASSYEQLLAKYREVDTAVTAVYARHTLLQFLESSNLETLTQLISVVDIVKWTVEDELSEDCVGGGLLQCNDYFYPGGFSKTEQTVSQAVYEPAAKTLSKGLTWLKREVVSKHLPELHKWTEATLSDLAVEIASNARNLDMLEIATAINGPIESQLSTTQNIIADIGSEKKPFPLHLPQSNHCGLVVAFKRNAFLCSNSTLKFYADAECTELLHEIRTDKQGRGNLSPMVFKNGKVWCSYNTFLDPTVSPYSQTLSSPSILKCRIFGVPTAWTTVVWLTETLAELLMGEFSPESTSCIKSLLDSVCTFMKVSCAPAPLRQLIFRLVTRLLRRLRYLNSELQTQVTVDEAWLRSLVDEIKVWRDNEFTGQGTFFSSYIQEGVETVLTALLPCDIKEPQEAVLGLELPDWLLEVQTAMEFLNYFRGEGQMSPALHKQVVESLQHDQWSHLYCLTGLSPDMSLEDKRTKVTEVLRGLNYRILDLDRDLQFTEDSALIVTDGYALKHYIIKDEEEEKKPEVEEERKEAEPWSCSVCTLENSSELTACDACGTAKPAEAADEEADVLEVKKTDLNVISEKLLNKRKEELGIAAEAFKQAFPEAKLETVDFEAHKDLLTHCLRTRTEQLLTTDLDQIKPELESAFGSSEKADLTRAAENPLAFWKALESVGVDLWLQQSLSVKETRFDIKHLEALMSFIESRMCQETAAVLIVPCSFVRQPLAQTRSINFAQDFTGSDLCFSLSALRYNWAKLKVFNRFMLEVISYFEVSYHSFLPQGALSLSVGSTLSEARGLLMLPIKVELTQKIFDKTAVPRQNAPKVELERLKLKKENSKKDYAYIRASEQLKDVSTAVLRAPKPQGSDPFIAFEVVFLGEMVVGESGPYRQFFADISKELQSEEPLMLLAPSPNNREKVGEGRDKWIIRPSANSAQDLQLFEFLGVLMGCCARTGARLTLDLPSFFWKPLVGETVRFEEMTDIDYPTMEMLKIIESASPELFSESFENFCIRLSDGSSFDLIPNGQFTPVTYENKADFIDRLLRTRFTESRRQSEAIRTGLAKLVPIGLLNLITWRQLEEWVCGRPVIDLELLRRHTRYSGGLLETTPLVQFFWEVLSEFSEEERLRFIKFCYGQERLPVNDEEFERRNIRLMLKPSVSENRGDGALPKADTCFFNLELPPYSTKEVMRDRLRFAITFDCDSMNADAPMFDHPSQPLDNMSDEE
jgi:hypothetical protein